MKEKVIVSVNEILEQLKAKSKPENLAGMARFGISTENRFGVSIPVLRKMAKDLGKKHDLALELWKTGVSEAMILASMIDEPAKLTEEQMELWVKDFNSWDVCDQVCLNVFEKNDLAWKKVVDWSKREEEFVKRAAFALLACLVWHKKEAEDQLFIDFLPIIKRESTDNRNFVKKAVNWALRNIGKRNLTLNRAAIDTGREIRKIDSKASRWIASNALKELESDAVQEKLEKLEKKKMKT